MSLPEIVLIAALAENSRVIGHEGTMPWHLPADLKRFKRLTLGHPVLMGRKTFTSILDQLGRPLPGRRNLVLTTQGPFAAYPEVETYTSLEAALDAVADCEKVFVAGGGTVYAQCLPLAHRLELTLVAQDPPGDTFFPPYAHLLGNLFQVVAESTHPGFRFLTAQRQQEAKPHTPVSTASIQA